MTTENTQARDLDQELLDELKAELPIIEGFTAVSEDPLGNIVYANDATEDMPAGKEYRIMLNRNPETVQTLTFHNGKPEEGGINGITLESLLDVLVDRITKLDQAKPSYHNNLAVDGILLASNSLNVREVAAKQAGVWGTDLPIPKAGNDNFHPTVRGVVQNTVMLITFIKMLTAMSESFEVHYDEAANKDFMVIDNAKEDATSEIQLTAEELESVTLQTNVAIKLASVLESTTLFKILMGTLAHSKKIAVSQSAPTSQPSPTNQETTQDSTQQPT